MAEAMHQDNLYDEYMKASQRVADTSEALESADNDRARIAREIVSTLDGFVGRFYRSETLDCYVRISRFENEAGTSVVIHSDARAWVHAEPGKDVDDIHIYTANMAGAQRFKIEELNTVETFTEQEMIGKLFAEAASAVRSSLHARW